MHKYEFYSDWDNHDEWWESGIPKIENKSDNESIDQIYKEKKELAQKINISINKKNTNYLYKQKSKTK